MEMSPKVKRKPLCCPKCGSRNLARYLFGLPDGSEKLERDVAFGKIVLGGRVIEPDVSPKYCCNDCGESFGIYMSSRSKRTG